MPHFDFFYSFTFWMVFILIAFFVRIIFIKPPLKACLLFVSSVFMLLALPRFSYVFLLLLTGATAFTFLIGRALNSKTRITENRKRKLMAFLGIFAILCFLALFKYRFVQDILWNGGMFLKRGASDIIFFIGISYFSFKMIHVVIESYRHKLENLNLLDYFNYIFLFPSFISGPINRYGHFSSQQIGPSRPTLKNDLKAGSERIVHGLFKKFVLVQLLYPHILTTQPQELAVLLPHKVALGLYACAFYFYFDFSAYSDLAIGCARILGIELPENFRWPFLKRNIRELWTNWHISLTSWLVDYIYWPIVRKMRNIGYFREHPVFLSNIGMIITFIICGMWHGESMNFILWGAYHGVGISVLTVYQRRKKKLASPFAQKYFRSKLSHWLGIVATFNYFTLGLALFVLDISKLQILISHLLAPK